MRQNCAVIFDFDGVLADTEALHLRAFQDVFAERGWNLEERDYFDRYLGYDDRGLMDLFAKDHALPLQPADVDTVLESKSVAYRGLLASGSVIYPGARECVQRLSERFPLAVASGSLHAEVVDILGAGGLLPAFSAIVGADDVQQSKPAPEPYLKAAELLSAHPARCVAIEDSHGGLDSARAAGMRTIAITTTSPLSALAEADRVIHRLDEITVELIDQLAGAHSS